MPDKVVPFSGDAPDTLTLRAILETAELAGAALPPPIWSCWRWNGQGRPPVHSQIVPISIALERFNTEAGGWQGLALNLDGAPILFQGADPDALVPHKLTPTAVRARVVTWATSQAPEQIEPTAPDWPEPLPLRRTTPPPDPFPLLALGPLLLDAAQAIGEVIQSPHALIGNSLLAGAALAVQGHADLEIDGRLFPTSLYVVTVADTGERKTATDGVVLAPHDQHQRTLRQQYENNLGEYELQLAAWKKAREECLSSKQNKTLQAKQDALRELGKEPTGPVDVVLMVEEPTYEGLVKALAAGWPSMGLFSDEGGRFLGGYAMNTDNQLKTAAGLSNLWDGRRITRSRGGDGNTVLYGRRLSLHLMIQPAVSHLLFGNNLLAGQGLLSRCLVTWPETNIGKHRYREVQLDDLPPMVAYRRRLSEILAAPLPLADGALNELNPRPLPLTAGAKARFIEFHDHVSALCAPDGALHPIKGLAAKSAEHAARLAGVLTLVDDLRAPTVSDAAMEAGIALAQFYLAEALRLFGAAAENPDLELAERCLAWARGRGGRFAAETLYQSGPNQVRDKATAERILRLLTEHGWARPLAAGEVVDGKPRRKAWEVRL